MEPVEFEPIPPKLTAVDVLKRARATIDTPEKWTKRTFALDAQGRKVIYSDGKACRFCLAGAIFRIFDDPNTGEITDTSELVIQQLLKTIYKGGRCISVDLLYAFNDSDATTHEMVLEVIDKTIERLEARKARNRRSLDATKAKLQRQEP